MKNKSRMFLPVLLGIFLCSACSGQDRGGAVENTGQESREMVITSVSVCSEINSICVEGILHTDEASVEAEDYSIGGLLLPTRTQAEQTEDGWQFCWYGFYDDEEIYQNPGVYVGYEELENVVFDAEVEEIPAKKFEAGCESGTVSVYLTPAAVAVVPEDGWEEGETYHIAAVGKDGKVYSMCDFPAKSGSSPKSSSVADAGEMGNGFASSVLLENNGVRYLMNKNIDPEDIEKIEIVSAD